RERVAPLLVKDDPGWNAGPLALLGREPRLGQVQLRAQKPSTHAGPQRNGRRDLAIRDLAERSTVLTHDADRVRALFGETGPIEDDHTLAFGNHGPQAAPHRGRVPRGVRDEVLERLIGDRLGDPRQHRLHRLPLAVAEDALDVVPQRQQLRAMPKTALELLEPPHQSLDARRGRVVDHRAAPYQMSLKSTMSSIQITVRNANESVDLTKSN